MAFINKQEREELERELKEMNDFIKVKRRLFTIDQKGRLVYFRNAQYANRLMTRFDLEGLGTRVTIFEKHTREPDKGGQYWNSHYELDDIEVEALPENRL